MDISDEVWNAAIHGRIWTFTIGCKISPSVARFLGHQVVLLKFSLEVYIFTEKRNQMNRGEKNFIKNRLKMCTELLSLKSACV